LTNIISVDPSLNSTAITIYYNNKYKYYSFLKGYKPGSKWCKDLEPFVDIFNVTYETSDVFSESEVLKLKQYSSLVNKIINIIAPYLNDSEIRIESYSQNSKNGRIQDLVTFGTLLRHKLYEKNENIRFITPKQLKKFIAKKVYGTSDNGVSYNNNKVAGGNFTKWDMLQCLIDSDSMSPLAVYSRDNYNIISQIKSVPKPLEDLIDAEILNLI